MECTDNGPEDGAEICWRGNTPTYSSCKPCPNLGNLEACPAHYICEYENCSKKYYKTGCEEGYLWDAAAETCTPECDPNDRYCQCPGKYFCDPTVNKIGDGAVCTTQDGTAFYERCLVIETCFQTDYYQNGVSCLSRNYNASGNGRYDSGVAQCTNQQGITFKYYCYCISSSENAKDPAGNPPPCYGYKECLRDLGYGEPCECGGRKYFNKCVAECTYEETAETCAAKSQSFEQKCYETKNGQQSWFGQCK